MEEKLKSEVLKEFQKFSKEQQDELIAQFEAREKENKEE